MTRTSGYLQRDPYTRASAIIGRDKPRTFVVGWHKFEYYWFLCCAIFFHWCRTPGNYSASRTIGSFICPWSQKSQNRDILHNVWQYVIICGNVTTNTLTHNQYTLHISYRKEMKIGQSKIRLPFYNTPLKRTHVHLETISFSVIRPSKQTHACVARWRKWPFIRPCLWSSNETRQHIT